MTSLNIRTQPARTCYSWAKRRQRKFLRNQTHFVSIYREEDEFEESDCAQSNRSNEDASVNDNNANESQTPSLGRMILESRNTNVTEIKQFLHCYLLGHTRDIIFQHAWFSFTNCGLGLFYLQELLPQFQYIILIPLILT